MHTSTGAARCRAPHLTPLSTAERRRSCRGRVAQQAVSDGCGGAGLGSQEKRRGVRSDGY
jgi:hypothetical protein